MLTIYQHHSDEIIPIRGYERLYDIQFITIKICCHNDIDYTQKVLYVCLKILTYYYT